MMKECSVQRVKDSHSVRFQSIQGKYLRIGQKTSFFCACTLYTQRSGNLLSLNLIVQMKRKCIQHRVFVVANNDA